MFIDPIVVKTKKYDISNQFLFHVPLFEIEINDIDNDLLCENIYKLKENDIDGAKRSNIGGWHSQMIEDDGCYKQLTDKFEHILPKLSFDPVISELEHLDIWSMINNKGNWNQIHNHLYNYNEYRTDLSGVYYVRVPEGNCGNILFRNPASCVNGNTFIQLRNHSSKEWETRFPKAGLMYIFPAYLDHMVLPNETDEDRVAISFNLTVK
mgnify:CR=1|tara:strand:- start:218 stop:844 length:627 start_codon:yes stop_codon:yes gene_type:complete